MSQQAESRFSQERQHEMSLYGQIKELLAGLDLIDDSPETIARYLYDAPSDNINEKMTDLFNELGHAVNTQRNLLPQLSDPRLRAAEKERVDFVTSILNKITVEYEELRAKKKAERKDSNKAQEEADMKSMSASN